MKNTKNNWKHWSNTYKHKDGRIITCEGDYKIGEVNFDEINCNIKMSLNGFTNLLNKKDE